jgi:hypothetical protein
MVPLQEKNIQGPYPFEKTGERLAVWSKKRNFWIVLNEYIIYTVDAIKDSDELKKMLNGAAASAARRDFRAALEGLDEGELTQATGAGLLRAADPLNRMLDKEGVKALVDEEVVRRQERRRRKEAVPSADFGVIKGIIKISEVSKIEQFSDYAKIILTVNVGAPPAGEEERTATNSTKRKMKLNTIGRSDEVLAKSKKFYELVENLSPTLREEREWSRELENLRSKEQLRKAGEHQLPKLDTKEDLDSALPPLPTLDTKEDFDRAQTSSKREGSLMVVFFTEEWVGPWTHIEPSIEAMAQEMPDVRFFKVYVDTNPELNDEYIITALPATLFFLGGEKKTTIKGADLEKIKVETRKLRPRRG